MYWHGTTRTENGRFLAVAGRVIDGKYVEFAGSGESVAEAKGRAMAVMWRQSRMARGLPEEHVSGVRRARMRCSA